MNEIFKYRLQVLEKHLDSFGHVNNAVYLQILEEARWDFITKNGYGLDVIKKLQKGPVILEVKIKFKRELKNREWIDIHSQSIEPLNDKMYILKQEIIGSEGKVMTEAFFTVGFFDLKERKLIYPDSEWLKAIGLKDFDIPKA
jgi:YbgC/YbaW family acyl-CoA thioester hydrolase